MVDAPPKKITVYLLDDHEIVRLGLKDLLESEGDIEVVGESGSVAHAQAQILALQPQVAVLDVRLPDGSGIDVCREIRSRDPNIAALILTSFTTTRPCSPRSWPARPATCSSRSAAPTSSTPSGGSPPDNPCSTPR